MIRPGDAVRGVRLGLRLCKIRVGLLASGACLAGYVMATSRLTGRVLPSVVGLLLLSGGAGALNQYQERHIDSRMERTRGRPIPNGDIAPRAALGIALALVGLGLVTLGAVLPLAALLGAVAVAWYNGIYTALKKVTPFAAVPGALTGAVPPAIGWVSAGGSLRDPTLCMLSVLLFIWQVPHFWLLLVERDSEYRGAGLPSLSDVFTLVQIRRIIMLWILGTAACSLAICLAGPVGQVPPRAALLGLASWLSYEAVRFRRLQPGARSRLFRTLNIFLACVLLVLCAASLAGRRARLEAGVVGRADAEILPPSARQ